MKPTNILITGGGIKGIIMLGIIKQLSKYKLLKNLNKYMGLSVGSIICLLLIIDYSTEELYKFINSFDFKVILKKTSFNNITYIDNLINNYGILNINNLKYTIEKLLKYKNIDKNITFKELYDITNKELIIGISCLTTCKTEYCNYINTPNFKIIDIISISCNIPLFFTPINFNNKLYLDGGFYNNLPIHYFDKEFKNTLIISEKSQLYNKINNFQEYLFNLLYSKTFFIENTIHYNKKNLNIIYIENKNNRSMIDFNITEKEKKNDYNIGIEICNKYIKNNYYYYYYLKKNNNFIY